MPSISFSGTPMRGAFWDLIIKGEKTQTIRKPRKRPFKVGDTLYLYWKMRQPKDKKPVHLIALSKIKRTVVGWGELSNILGLFDQEHVERIMADLRAGKV